MMPTTLACTWCRYGAWTSPPPWLRAEGRAPTVHRDAAWPDLERTLLTARPAPADLPWACSDKRCRARRPSRWRRPGDCPRCGAALIPDKTSLPAWSPWRFKAARTGPVELAALVLDYDGGVTLDDIRLRWAPWYHVGHTSWSHQHEDDARARVVLPLAAPVDLEMWPRVWAWAFGRDERMDPTAAAAGRIFFLPFVHLAPATTWRHEGPVLDVRTVQLPDLSQPTPRDRARPPMRADRSRADELRRSPEARRALATQLGARLTGEGDNERARRCPSCPWCGERSVWWWIRPRSWEGCGCDHDSCGWTGWLDQLSAGAH